MAAQAQAAPSRHFRDRSHRSELLALRSQPSPLPRGRAGSRTGQDAHRRGNGGSLAPAAGKRTLPPWRFLVALLPLFLWCHVARAQLQRNFYRSSCPRAETIIRAKVRNVISRDPTQAASLLRLHFHDCFVDGCDGSLLLDNPDGIPSEKEAAINFGVRGFEIIDDIKARLERVCPGTVSCADILALAARDAVRAVGGPSIPMQTGRRDGFTSRASRTNTLPSFSDINGLIATFANVGLFTVDMIALSGAHTIGQGHCLNVENRIRGNVDNLIDPAYRFSLGRQCFSGGQFQPNNTVANDPVTTILFDNQYFKNIQVGKGTFITDSLLLTDRRTRWHVNKFASDSGAFFRQFNKSMISMSQINVLTGGRGEVRFDCSATNEY